MAALNIGDQSSVSAPTDRPLVPFITSTSDQIAGLIVIKPTPPKLERNADFAVPDQRTAHTERADDEIQSFASREIAQSDQCKLQDVNITAGGIDRSREDKLPVNPVISGKSASSSLRNAQEEHKRRPLQKLKWDRRSDSPEEAGEEEEGGESACVTPTATEQRIPQENLICPPPPCKKRHCSKRKRDAMAAASSSSSSSSSTLQKQANAADQAHAAALQLVVNPPDLHTFPECIRALFSPN